MVYGSVEIGKGLRISRLNHAFYNTFAYCIFVTLGCKIYKSRYEEGIILNVLLL